MRQKTFTRIVVDDHKILIGGPNGKTRTLAVFRKGQRLTVVRDSENGEYPKMYTIAERPRLGELSRGVLTKFLKGFERRRRTKEPEQ